MPRQRFENFDDFALHAAELLRDHAEPMEDGPFWELVAWLDWPKRPRPDTLGRKLSRHLDLERLASASVAAADQRDGLEEAMERRGGAVHDALPSEDGMDDLCYHIVGMGADAHAKALADDGLALELVEEDRAVESFRYVFQEAFARAPYAAYDEVLRRRFLDPDAMTAGAPPRVVVSGDVVGVVYRIEGSTLLYVTPHGYETIERKT